VMQSWQTIIFQDVRTVTVLSQNPCREPVRTVTQYV
jgi:hypothetical protein